ncbi:cell envelope integrity protein TolA [Collimonas sp. H4R21]|uniref:Cell envelope integrity protein TolA n=1 Tax=Collimonas rhizosphaerae TaxID=3126357 RepID=A0ABU9PPV5_9BURK|nr:cell envelope integrity protein TolA [Collimonas sp. OK412]
MNPGELSQADQQRAGQWRISKIVGVLVSVLVHILGIWFLLTKLAVEMPVASPSPGNMGLLLISEAAAPSSVPPPKTQATPAKPKSAPKPRKSAPKQEQVRKPVVATAPEPAIPPPPDAPKYQQSVEEDFSTHIQAARQRREAALAQERAEAGETAEDAPQSPNDIARANIQAQRGWMGMDKDKSGGIFEVRDKTPFRASLIFRGWNANVSRSAQQNIPVERGSDESIEMAIVNKMIEMIRKKTSTDIPWRSQRLGRVITLSARLKDTAELQQFLMREMFYQDSAPPR